MRVEYVKAHGSTLQYRGHELKISNYIHTVLYYFALSSMLWSGTQGFSVPLLSEHGSGDEKIKYALKSEILYLIPFGAQNVFNMHICTPIPDI